VSRSSYERINYSLRPAKCAERKMLCDGLRPLQRLRTLKSFRYIGFGSTYFSDFILFHKHLGLENLVSIEKDRKNSPRFEFNKPFGYIKLKYGKSGEVLPTLDWNNAPTIAWFDYDNRLTADVLADTSYFISNASVPSVLILTVNVDPEPPDVSAVDRNKSRLESEVGIEKVPADVTEKDLEGWGLAKTSYRIIANEIADKVAALNGGAANRLLFKQLFHFHYSDGAKMLTVGGLLYDEGQDPDVASCSFDRLDFVRGGAEPYALRIPSLTFREMRKIDEKLPARRTPRFVSIPIEDIKQYIRIYKYFPTFAETEL